MPPSKRKPSAVPETPSPPKRARTSFRHHANDSPQDSDQQMPHASYHDQDPNGHKGPRFSQSSSKKPKPRTYSKKGLPRSQNPTADSEDASPSDSLVPEMTTPQPKAHSKKDTPRSQTPTQTADPDSEDASSNSPAPEIATHNSSHKGPMLVEWDEDDEDLLQDTPEEEVRLWRRTLDLFGVIPPQLLPPGVDVTSSDSKSTSGGATYKAAGQKGAWTRTLSTIWLRVLCLPVFLDNDSYFTYCLALALSCRTKSHWPAKKMIYDKEGKLKDSRLRFVNHIIPVHNDANATHSDPLIMSRDLDIIERAWDVCADKKNKRNQENKRTDPEIPNLKWYHSNFTGGLGRPGTWRDKSKGFILDLKKKWLISKANPDVAREPSPVTPEMMTLDLIENGKQSYARIPLIPMASKRRARRALPEATDPEFNSDSEHEATKNRRKTSHSKRQKIHDSDKDFGAGSQTARRWAREGKKLGEARKKEANELRIAADAKKATVAAEQAVVEDEENEEDEEDEVYSQQIVVSSLGIRIEIPSKKLDSTAVNTAVVAADPGVVGVQASVQVPCSAPLGVEVPGVAAIPEKPSALSTAPMIPETQIEDEIRIPDLPHSNATSSPSATPTIDSTPAPSGMPSFGHGVGSGPSLGEAASRMLSSRLDPLEPDAYKAIYKPAALLGNEWDLTGFQSTNKFSVGRIPMTGFDSTALSLPASEEEEPELSEDNWHDEILVLGGDIEDEVVKRWIDGFPRPPYHEWKPT